MILKHVYVKRFIQIISYLVYTFSKIKLILTVINAMTFLECSRLKYNEVHCTDKIVNL